MSQPNNPPAFPSAQTESVFVEEFGRYEDRLTPPVGGMTLRDYFAAHALHAIDFKNVYGQAIEADVRPSTMLAMIVYDWADAMLVEREKGSR